jgi:chemotaxis protein methyltransferase WspC
LLVSHNFTHTRIPLAFAFTKGKSKPPVSLSTEPAMKRSVALPSPSLKPRSTQKPVVIPASPIPPVAPAAAPDLAEAQRLADEGRLGDVTGICQASLKQSGPSAEAYYLLGLVSDAADRTEEAIAYYRKALYLNPQHHDALLHCSLLTARCGDAVAAQALRERARRSSEKVA